MPVLRPFAICATAALVMGNALAQDRAATAPPPPPSAPAQDLEPAVDTSATPDKPQPKTAPRATPTVAPSQPAAPSAVGRPKAPSKDRIELDTTQITGNRELPKVLYIVPWKHSDLSDLTGRPANSLLDEVLTPVDRDVFKRENRYYGALNPDEPRTAGGAAAAPADRAAADASRSSAEK